MVVIKIELWRHGREEHKRDLGRIHISSIGGTETRGSYRVECFKAGDYARRSAAIWRTGRVVDFRRKVQGAYDLLLLALISCVGDRNAPAVLGLGQRTLSDEPVEGL